MPPPSHLKLFITSRFVSKNTCMYVSAAEGEEKGKFLPPRKFSSSHFFGLNCCCILTYPVQSIDLKFNIYKRVYIKYFFSPRWSHRERQQFQPSSPLYTRRIFYCVMYVCKIREVRSIFKYIHLHIIFSRMFSRENVTLDW